MTFPPRFLCDEMLGRLCRYLRARISVQSALYCEGKKVGEFDGDFVAIVL